LDFDEFVIDNFDNSEQYSFEIMTAASVAVANTISITTA